MSSHAIDFFYFNFKEKVNKAVNNNLDTAYHYTKMNKKKIGSSYLALYHINV